jgi:hypothetical protein
MASLRESGSAAENGAQDAVRNPSSDSCADLWSREAVHAANAAEPAFDVFNGDADGLCALHQLRLARPAETTLITGVKRDIELLRRVPVDRCGPGMLVTVLDISLDSNHAALASLLDSGVQVAYYDHHSAGRAFRHPRLQLAWDDSPDVCTSLIVDRQLAGRFRRWAIAAAFGDNLDACARRLAAESGLSEAQVAGLASLGRVINYNAYGETVDDLLIAPDALYRELRPYADPLEFIADSACYGRLEDGYRSDTARLDSIEPHWAFDDGAVYVLPNADWARRICGVLANRLASARPGASFAVLTETAGADYTVSVRSGDPHKRPANAFCERFATGGGRRAAGGINRLPADAAGTFFDAFKAYFGTDAGSHHGTDHAANHRVKYGATPGANFDEQAKK